MSDLDLTTLSSLASAVVGAPDQIGRFWSSLDHMQVDRLMLPKEKADEIAVVFAPFRNALGQVATTPDAPSLDDIVKAAELLKQKPDPQQKMLAHALLWAVDNNRFWGQSQKAAPLATAPYTTPNPF